MRKIGLLLVSVVMFTTLEAKEEKDPVVMTVAGKDILLSEFLFIAKKDHSVDLNDKKSVANYVELFKTYKLKGAEAEALTIHKATKFELELDEYKRQLQESFLSDKAGEDSAMYVIYERSKFIPGFKHLLFLLPDREIISKDTVGVYNQAMAAYNRIMNGESFESVGESCQKEAEKETPKKVIYADVDYIYPMQMLKVLEDQVYNMEPGEISPPIRSMRGYHLIKMYRKIPNPGKVRVSHILTSLPSENPTEEEVAAARLRADSIRQKALAGEDFSTLAKEYSDDTINGQRGGLLPYFGLGEMIKPVEDAAFALENEGDISEPIQTQFGFHVLKLISRRKDIPYEEMESHIYEMMKSTERNFDLYRRYDEKLKARHHYVFYPEAFAELEQLADSYFPTDTAFLNRGLRMEKTLVQLDSIDFPQSLFAEYVFKKPHSAKKYSVDLLREVFDLFVREIVTEMEREVLERDYPEYNMLVNEYYDGILLFEITSKRVWDHPAEEQAQLEAEWLKELNEKYPVTINWKVLKKLQSYLN